MSSARSSFLRRLALLVLGLLAVGALGRAAGDNEALPADHVISGVLWPVPRVGRTLPSARALDAPSAPGGDASAPRGARGADRTQRATPSSTR